MSVLAQLNRLCECFFLFTFFFACFFWTNSLGVFWLFSKPDSLLHSQIAAQHATNVALGTYESRDHLRCDRNEVLGYTKTTQNMAKQELCCVFCMSQFQRNHGSCKASSFNYCGWLLSPGWLQIRICYLLAQGGQTKHFFLDLIVNLSSNCNFRIQHQQLHLGRLGLSTKHVFPSNIWTPGHPKNDNIESIWYMA